MAKSRSAAKPKPASRAAPGSKASTTDLLAILQARFERNPARHKGITWPIVQQRLASQPAKLRSLQAMEASGGEPDVVKLDAKSGELLFVDCSPETPAGRRSLCYDGAALKARKEHPPASSALDEASAMGIEILDETGYRALQELGEFDLKTSSWILTPADIRKLDGALFCDRRYGKVFTYHNGAQSYYASRGFRGSLRV